MSPATARGITGAEQMVGELWAYSPEIAFDFVVARHNALDPDDHRFHPFRQAFEAAQERLVAHFHATYLDVPGALL